MCTTQKQLWIQGSGQAAVFDSRKGKSIRKQQNKQANKNIKNSNITKTVSYKS